jgi:hypothetical protein
MCKFCIALGLLLTTGVVQAEEPATIGYAANDGLLPARPAATEVITPVLDTNRVELDILFGLPVALRLQRQIGESRAWVEGGLALYVFIPSVFVGMRFDGLLHRGERDGLHLRPGVDVYYSPIHGDSWFWGNFNGLAALCADVDMVWRHQWGQHLCSQIGVKLGVGLGSNLNNNLFPLPILGFTMGLEF